MMGEPKGGTGVESSSLATQATFPATMLLTESGKSPRMAASDVPGLRLPPAPPTDAGRRNKQQFRGTRRRCSFVPGGTLILPCPCHPGMDPWAIICRPEGWSDAEKFCAFFGLWATYRRRETSISRARPQAEVAATRCWGGRMRLRHASLFRMVNHGGH